MKLVLVLSTIACVLAVGVHIYDPSGVLNIDPEWDTSAPMTTEDIYHLIATAAALPTLVGTKSPVSRATIGVFANVTVIEPRGEPSTEVTELMTRTIQLSSAVPNVPPTYASVNNAPQHVEAPSDVLTQCTARYCHLMAHTDIPELSTHVAETNNVYIIVDGAAPALTFSSSLYRLSVAAAVIVLVATIAGAAISMWRMPVYKDPLVYSGPGPVPAIDTKHTDGGDYFN